MNKSSSQDAQPGVKYCLSSDVIPQYIRRPVPQALQNVVFVTVIPLILLKPAEGFCVKSMALLEGQSPESQQLGLCMKVNLQELTRWGLPDESTGCPVTLECQISSA